MNNKQREAIQSRVKELTTNLQEQNVFLMGLQCELGKQVTAIQTELVHVTRALAELQTNVAFLTK